MTIIIPFRAQAGNPSTIHRDGGQLTLRFHNLGPSPLVLALGNGRKATIQPGSSTAPFTSDFFEAQLKEGEKEGEIHGFAVSDDVTISSSDV